MERTATKASIVKDKAELGLGGAATVEFSFRTLIENFWPLLQWSLTVQ